MSHENPPMTLDDWLVRLESLHPDEIELGLARIASVARKLPVTDIAKRVITVGGTNGKGSTICLLAAVLEAAGLKVGCYTSPHFLRYNERVKINGEMVSDEALCAAFSRVDQARGETELTYFEFGTLAAFDLFARADLDIALLEVGLGGRLDATNIVDPDIAVITSIALDHQDWLGNTRESIGYEKAGIMRAGIPAVCGDLDPPLPLIHHAESLAVELDCREQQFGGELTQDASGAVVGWHWWGHRNKEKIRFENLPVPAIPLANAATAIQALMHLGLPIDAHHLETGLRQAKLAGRFQRLQSPVPMILDVAHNPEAAEYLASQLEKENVPGKIYGVIGMLSDKDSEAVIQQLAPLIGHWAACDLDAGRALSAQDMADKIRQFDGDVDIYPDVGSALKSLSKSMTEEDLLVVLGSFYTVSAALEFLKLEG